MNALTTTLLASAVALSGCRPAVPHWCAHEAGDALRIDEPASRWTSPATLEGIWRIDGSADGRELVLPASAALSTEAGRIAIVDFDLGEVIIASLDGRWLGRLGRRGGGPGEFGHAIAARWAGPDALDVYDPALSKIVRFDTTGAPLSDTPVDASLTATLGGGLAWISYNADGTMLTRPIGDRPESANTLRAVILRLDPARTAVDTMIDVSVPAVAPAGWMPFPAPGWAMPHAAVSATGDVAIAGDRQEYRLTIRRPDGSRLVICRTDARPTDAVAGEPDERIEPSVRAAIAAAPRPPVSAAIGRITYDETGRLWVQRGIAHVLRPADTAIGTEAAMLDVYADGRYLGAVQLPARTRFLGATADVIIGLERNDYDELSIVAFRMP